MFQFHVGNVPVPEWKNRACHMPRHASWTIEARMSSAIVCLVTLVCTVTSVQRTTMVILRFLVVNAWNVNATTTLTLVNPVVVIRRLAIVFVVSTTLLVNIARFANPASTVMHWNILVSSVFAIILVRIQDPLLVTNKPDSVPVCPMWRESAVTVVPTIIGTFRAPKDANHAIATRRDHIR